MPSLLITIIFAMLAGVVTPSSATILTFDANLSGSAETPPNPSSATGDAIITFDTISNLLSVDIAFSGLLASATAAHIHCCASPGTNISVAVAFPGFPNATSGTYSNTFDLLNASIYTSSFLTNGGGTAAGAESALIAGLSAGMAYVNIHDATYPGGEVRGFANQVATVPEPSTLLLLSTAAIGLAIRRKLH
ncbi:MAG: CHRD domain-containing protein [Thiobacillaceae bacterium]|jgi:hypothetical protein